MPTKDTGHNLVGEDPPGLQFVTNCVDPDRMDFATRSCDELQDPRYWDDKIIRAPKATEAYTVEQLESFGLVGVYIEVNDAT